MSNEFWMDEKEQEFFMSFITPETELLEYGSGNSTLFLQDKVKRMVSVEHNREWFDKLVPQLGEKVTYIYEKPNNDHWENQYTLGLREDGNVDAMKNAAGDDGTFEDFISYVISPSRHGKFDIVFIDGRARVSCAWMSTFLLKDENSRIFIHDFGPEASHPKLPHRTYYDIAKHFLEEVDHVKTMYCFKPKGYIL